MGETDEVGRVDGGGEPPGRSTDEYRAGTEEYSFQTDPRMRGRDGGVREDREGEDDAGERRGGDSSQRESVDTRAFWERNGYASLQEFLDELEAGWEAIGWSDRPRSLRKDVRGAAPPPGEAPREDDARSRRRKSRQVNVKLTPSEHEALMRASRRYAVAPSTLAAILVYRGAVAALRADSEAAGPPGNREAGPG